MKRQLITMILLLLMAAIQGVRAQEPYAVLSSDNTILTFYYDNQKAARGGMSVGPFNNSFPSWYNQCQSIKTVVFDNSFADCTSITSMTYWFYNCRSLTSITGLENLNTANVTEMNGMFYGCSSLTSLDVSHFNTDNVTNMWWMFRDCSGLTSLDVSNFNTANVTRMNGMFDGCSSLTSLDVSNFNTANVKDMGLMFIGCSSLTSLDVSHFNTTNVTEMEAMFRDCIGLTTIYCNDTWSCDSSWRMFYGCTSLLGAIAYDTNKVDATYANPDTGYFTRTGETSVPTLNAADGQQNIETCYSISGLRLTAPQKGINIIGGKKVVIK